MTLHSPNSQERLVLGVLTSHQAYCILRKIGLESRSNTAVSSHAPISGENMILALLHKVTGGGALQPKRHALKYRHYTHKLKTPAVLLSENWIEIKR